LRLDVIFGMYARFPTVTQRANRRPRMRDFKSVVSTADVKELQGHSFRIGVADSQHPSA
jgi:hypothetical protein